MITTPRRLGHLLEAKGTISFAVVADVLRNATRLRSRKSIADFCAALADELDRNDATQEVSERARLRRNLNLSRAAASLLQTLASAPTRMHRHDDLTDTMATTRGALKVYVCEIRRSFEAAGLDNAVETVWGEGYILTVEGAALIGCAPQRILKAVGTSAGWYEALADELDRFEGNDATQAASARVSLQRNLNLSRAAANLLQTLAIAPARLHRHDDLIDTMATTRGALKVYVCEIRRSFEAAGLDDAVETVWGEGYILTAEGAAFIRYASQKFLRPVGGGPAKKALPKAAWT